MSENIASTNKKNIIDLRDIVVEFDGERSAKVIVDGDQLSLAIGKEGQNARLAAKLTGFKIDIKAR